MNTNYILPQTAPIYHKTRTPRLTRQQKANRMDKDGYSYSQPISDRSLFLVHKPGATGRDGYQVRIDGQGVKCDCTDCKNGNECKHFKFVVRCERHAATLPSVKTRLLFNRLDSMERRSEANGRHLEALAVLAGELAERAAGITL